jgi:hypothetical protein
MVGASPLDSQDRFRAAYEVAVHRATRAGDHQQALALSRAYDQLSWITRQQIYPTAQAVVVGAGPPPPPRRPPGAGAAMPPKRRPQRPRVQRGDLRTRLVLYGVFLPVAVVVGTYYGVHNQPSDTSGGDSVPQEQPVVPVPISTATATVLGPSVVVPRTARVDGKGLVTLICQPGPGLAGYVISAQPGAIVVCTNGATPAVVG